MERITYSPTQEQGTWQYKAVLATRGNQTIVGTILLQLIGRNAKHPPMISSTATVDEAGLCWCFLVPRNGTAGVACLGRIGEIRDEFRRLADYLKLDDSERIELFDELRKWVAVDLRADHDEMKRATLH